MREDAEGICHISLCCGASGLLAVVYEASSPCDIGTQGYHGLSSVCKWRWSPWRKKGTFNLNLEQFSSSKAWHFLESKDSCKWSFTI